VWLGLADPLMAHAPFALASDVLRRVLGIAEDEPLAARREKVRARAGDDRIAVFLGEIAGAPFEDAADPVLRAARNNPGLLSVQAEEALVAFARTELSQSPLAVVLEDVHWADAASLRLFQRLLDRERAAALFVLALARPGVDQAHANLWEGVRCQRIALQPLLKKAAVKIARALLGEDADVEAIVDRAEGNALFVEELARARLDGDTQTELPLTVMAAAEARIATLPADARVVLRAGAVFGERFWRGGVAQLVGSKAAAALDAHLETLERADVVTRSTDSRFRGDVELVFRHALVRDAAYAMLPDHDRTLAHALAGEWLEPPNDDSVLLAHH
jgi:eukaryotic-like serine/threonine-protein kinase